MFWTPTEQQIPKDPIVGVENNTFSPPFAACGETRSLDGQMLRREGTNPEAFHLLPLRALPPGQLEVLSSASFLLQQKLIGSRAAAAAAVEAPEWPLGTGGAA